jgi:hypothetical protein
MRETICTPHNFCYAQTYIYMHIVAVKAVCVHLYINTVAASMQCLVSLVYSVYLSSKLFAKLNAPLIKGVDAPDEALYSSSVLIQC